MKTLLDLFVLMACIPVWLVVGAAFAIAGEA